MAFSDFTLKDVERQFHLAIGESPDLFAAVPEVPESPLLRELLQEYIPLALAINTEKARSELLIAPILVAVRHQLRQRISLFSGVDFPADPDQGLNGTCDFILSASPQQLYLSAPVVAVVEAKNENLKSGFGQCLAVMVGARLFNDREGTGVQTVYGAVTTGTLWRFLQLAASSVTLDQQEHHIKQIGKLLGILVHLMRQQRDEKTEA